MKHAVRLQLSRRRGFDLQALSRSVNGLPAVNVARPSRWGNPVTRRDFEDLQAALAQMGRVPVDASWREHVVKCYEAWIGGEMPVLGTPPTIEEIARELRGKNLACWCGPDQPCHADVLLQIANRFMCEEVRS